MVDVKALMQAAKNTTVPSCEERMALYNSRRGDLTGYDCPICRNKGFVFLMKDGYEYTMECECMEKRRGKWRLKRSGLQDMAERYRFETYEAKTSWQKSILAAAECFCEEGEGWFYIGGQVGAGKTHICTAIANRLLLQGKGVRYMIWTEEATKLKALKTDDENYAREINKWKTAEVLYIDDFLKTRNGALPTDGDINLAFEIINARYNNRALRTIFSGERGLNEIMELDEAMGSRIYQRCGKYKLKIGWGEGRNYRTREELEV